jgi:hypothetical protein
MAILFNPCRYLLAMWASKIWFLGAHLKEDGRVLDASNAHRGTIIKAYIKIVSSLQEVPVFYLILIYIYQYINRILYMYCYVK